MQLVKVVPEIAIAKESIVFFASSGHSLHSNVMSQLMSQKPGSCQKGRRLFIEVDLLPGLSVASSTNESNARA